MFIELITTCLLLLTGGADEGDHFQGQWWTFVNFGQPVFHQSGPSLAIDGGGVRHVTFTGYGTCGGSTLCGVYYQFSPDGRTWNPAVLVPGSEDVFWLSYPAIVATPEGRVYIAWFGTTGVELSWTDDLGRSFAPEVSVAPYLPTSYFSPALEVDAFGALHCVWAGSDFNLYYVRSLPAGALLDHTRVLPHGIPSGTQGAKRSSDPVFLPAQRLYAEDGKAYNYTFVGVDDLGFVSIVYAGGGTIYFTRSHHGLTFPPAVKLADAGNVQLAVSPHGPITIVYSKIDADSKERVYSLVSLDDGAHFDGPFKQTDKLGVIWQRRCISAGRAGDVYAAWVQEWKGKGKLVTHLTYAESHDFGKTFPLRDFVHDNRDWPAGNDPDLALSPNGERCLVVQTMNYTQGR